MKWAYGVTTFPTPDRRENLLPRTLASLAAAGFDSPRLFVDGEDNATYWASRFGRYERTLRSPKVGVTGNWLLSLGELYVRSPSADRYAIFQDDVVVVRNLRAYLDRAEWPRNGYLNLFTFRENEDVIRGKPFGFYEASYLSRRPETRPDGKRFQTGRSATALVFDNAGAETVITHLHMVKKLKEVDGNRRVDGAVVYAMGKAGYVEYVHNPSLVQHTGLRSTIGNHNQPRADSFPGEEFDALELLG